MNVAIIGTGYVGLVTGACLADFGHCVSCVDVVSARIDTLLAGEIPFYEPGLAELVSRNAAAGRLRFTTNLGEAVRTSAVVFVAVGTPEGATGEADISQVAAVAASIAEHIGAYKVVATKSTVPVGTGARLTQWLRERVSGDVAFDVVSNPEFLREGSAVNDFLRPDRVVIGTSSERAALIMRELYRPLYLIETPIVVTDVESAEMIKYASNAFLAVKIGFMNEIANLCERVGADVHVVAKGMGLDKRIGSKFLHAGPGYGGSCFPKDTRALAVLGATEHARQRIVEAAIEANTIQRQLVVDKITRVLGGVAGRRIAVLGLAFKPNTDDVREAPALYVCRELAHAGAHIRAFDPVACERAADALGAEAHKITFATDAYDAVKGAHAAVIMTEWNEFRGLDLSLVHSMMAEPVLFDTRNALDPLHAVKVGFAYFGTGRGQPAVAEVVR